MSKRYASLDTLRALAIIMVFIAHLTLILLPFSVFAPLQVGGIGVDLFFLLSGWLLGNQLFKELKNDNTINVPRFLYRRWLRTLPAYYFVLALTLAQRFLKDSSPILDLSYLFFFQNYKSDLSYFYVSWSLCVEEQFYLLVAPLLILLSRFKTRASLIALLMLFLVPFCLRSMHLFSSTVETHVRMDCCLMGVLLAKIFYQHTEIWRLLVKNVGKIIIGTSVIGAAFIVNRWLAVDWLPNEDPLLLAFIFGSWIIWVAADPEHLEKLRVPCGRYVAQRSYAIYLLHPEALALVHHIKQSVPLFISVLVAIAVTLACAEVLYRFIELPFMRYRDR